VDRRQFINKVIKQARLNGYKVNFNRGDVQQIDFGNKTLHTDQIGRLFPHILDGGADIAKEIDRVAVSAQRPLSRPHFVARRCLLYLGHSTAKEQ